MTNKHAQRLKDLAAGLIEGEIKQCEYYLAADEINRLDVERQYWMEKAVGYAQELSGISNDYQHPLAINGVKLDDLEEAIKSGYQTSVATQLDMIALVRRILTT